jgi:predicted O-methyltransferase YrrM
MYNRFQLAKKYFHYYFTSSNGKGHGIHSPFVFNFIKDVLNDKRKIEGAEKIEEMRRHLLHNNSSIEVIDLGAGSSEINTKKRSVKSIAASSLKKKKYAELLARIVKYCKAQSILELGTSLGITTSYLASTNPASTVYTLEGSKNIALIAQNNFDKIGLKNINLIQGNFDKTLPELFNRINKIDFAFVDGNHRRKPTLQYFDWLTDKINKQSVFIFDDIHWSKEMEDAWKEIQEHPFVTLTIDLFFVGLVFFNNDFKVKQHFVIRF